ncbi:MAG: Ig-like domain-containing protein, partial [Rudaea sp.]
MNVWVARFSALSLLLASGFAAGQNTYSAYINSDGDTATGCVITLPGGTFAGAEWRVQATATTGSSPQVTSVTLAQCGGGVFGAGTPIGGNYPVGLNDGTSGSDVVEFSAPKGSILGNGSYAAPLGFVAENASGSDVLFAADGGGGGGIVLGMVAPTPALGAVALILLALLLLLIARRTGRGRLYRRVLGLSLFAICGIAIAATFFDDGQVGDWNGISPIATDPAGDPSNASPDIDLRAAFVAVDGGQIHFRLDVTDMQTQSPVITSANATTFYVGTPGTFTVTATGVPTPALTSTCVPALPAGVTFVDNGNGTATLAGTPPLGSTNTYACTLTASNAIPPDATQNFTFTIANAPSTTALVVDTNPSVFGQSVTFTATVTATPPGSGTPTGTVTFLDGATSIGTGTLDGSGVATLATGALSVATHSITAQYAGDADFGPSTSTAVSQVVNQAATTTALTSGANPSVFGQNVTFTATVTPTAPGAGTPTGTVTFKDGATTLGTGTLAGGVATFSTSTLSVTTHPVTAAYAGDTSFQTSTSSTVSQVVNQAATTTAVVSSANPSVFGQSVTFTATVTATAPGAGTPTGTVTFKDGATTLGTGALNGSGVATFSTSTLSVAAHSITAAYGGDTNDAASTSAVLTQTVNQGATTTALVSATNPSVFNQSVTFTATVTATAPAVGTPTGTVNFLDGATNIGSGALDASGVATFSTSTLSVATHPITAVYAGDTNFQTSTSAAVSQVVNQGATTTAVVSNSNPSLSGNAVTFTATVAVTAPASGTPTGNVTFMDGATSLGNGILNASLQATLTTSALSAGTHSITAVYAGDANFSGSTSPAITQTVNQAPAITSANSTIFMPGVAGSFTVTTTGFPTGAAMAINETGALPAGLTFTNNNDGTATLAGTTSAGGDFPITITANNGIAPNATQAFIIHVQAPPAITSANNVTFVAGTAGTNFTVTTTGFPTGASMLITETGALPSGVTFTNNNDGTATITNTAAAGTGGTYPITITANNGIAPNATQAFTITVNEAPAITSANNTTFVAGSAGNFSVTTTGFPTGASMAISEAGALPTGVTFVNNNNGTASLAGTPAAGTGGSYPITITADNGVAPSATQSFTLTVQQAPTITSANSTTFTVGTAGTFSVTATGVPGGASIALSEAGALPGGVAFVDNGNGTATLAGAPDAGSGGSYALTITA